MIRGVFKTALLPLTLLALLCAPLSPPFAQVLNDIEIRAGYCLGALDYQLEYAKAHPPPHDEEVSKTISHYQEMARSRGLTPVERQLYEAAKTILSIEDKARLDRERVFSYLRAKGLFSPVRALDFAELPTVMNSGKADLRLCAVQSQIESVRNCERGCALSHRDDRGANSACYKGCQPTSCQRLEPCETLTWLPR
jgi:hypothetical protein